MVQQQVYDVSQLIDDQRITSFNLRVIFLSFLALVAFEYVTWSASLAGPGLVQAFHVDRAKLGLVFSASELGIFFGGPMFAFVGDRLGRRKAILWGSLLFSVMTLVAVTSHSLNELMVIRFITGLGLGGVPANCMALNAELVPKRMRAKLIILVLLGNNIGSMLPSIVTAALGEAYRWQTVFMIGGILSLAIGILLYFFLPESIKFLVLQGKSHGAVTKLIARVRPDLAFAPNAEFIMPTSGEKKQTVGLVRRLFSEGLARITVLLWVLFILIQIVIHFVHSWMPIIFHDAGISIRHMGIITALYNVGGIFGALVIGSMLDKWGTSSLSAAFLLCCPFVAAIGISGLPLGILASTVFFTGFCVTSIYSGLNATAAITYPTAFRANGTAWAISVGRLGGVLGPIFGAWLIGKHASTQQLFLVPAIPLAIGATAAFGLGLLCIARFKSDQSVQVA